MGKSIKGTRTEKNLGISFAGESQARMRYTYFASAAKKEGYEQIAAIFTETADQEKEHGNHGQLSVGRDRHHTGEPESCGGRRK